uniref:Glycosyl transferase family protein n=1 Tax=uncultured marine thaumarchaeote SAT1000_09_A04 TaxID=1456366 RepID=A0A075I2T2_9ARCH|nr:glycosyl transferase family protein [uncultured marine thaumarchaeote SAT1000_09_A04]
MKKEHQNPKVSIILPARNEEKFIDKCIISLVNQDYSNYEIVAINDSSEDSTGDIIKNTQKISQSHFRGCQTKTRRMDGKKLGMC